MVDSHGFYLFISSDWVVAAADGLILFSCFPRLDWFGKQGKRPVFLLHCTHNT